MHTNLFFNDNAYSRTDTASIPYRKDVEEKYKWNLSDIFCAEELWEKDFYWIKENTSKLKKFRGTLGNSSGSLAACLKFDDEINIKLERLYLYAMLSKDSDMRENQYQAMYDRIKNLFAQISAASSFIRPELLAIDEQKLKGFLNSNPELKVYQHFLDNLLRTKTHTLSPEQEKILALSTEVTPVSYDAFSMFTNADLKFPRIKDENGNEVEISHGKYYAALYSKDRSYRERAFKNYLKPYREYANTFAALFNGNLKANIFNAKARNYNSALEASLDKNNIPVSVYDNLIKSANDNLEPLHRWASLKKKILKLDELHPYDVYVTLFSAGEKKYSFEEAKEIVLESLKPMGEDYLNSLQKAFNNRWIDVFETQAKRSGAYSSGTTYGVHPYVLLNWTDLLNDVFTLAHEMGHNMHSYYTGMNQPFPYANYSIFLAEVASTFNEALLQNYLIENTSSKNEKLYLLERYLNNITATFYRQTMFAEYEKKVYELSESGMPLTQEDLSRLNRELYKKYWGPEMIIDEEENFTWARIPHFYYNFYVFQYATGFSASEALSNKVLIEGKPAVNNYLQFLKSGSSDYSINILKKAGVDMNSPEPVKATTQKMNRCLDEIEKLLAK